MVMRRRNQTVAIAAFLGALSLTASAAAQEFANAGGLREALAALQAQARQSRALLPRPGAMGAGRVAAEADLTAAVAPDISAYPVRGVDISHYEGGIAWDQVKLAGLSFVYMKATEGGDFVDEKFADNWRGATSAGLVKGAYHFYNFCKGGAEQAANFVATVPAEADALPMTIDLEESAACRKMPKKAAFRADLAAFVEKVRAAYGRTPVLYVNYSIYAKYFQGESDAYKLWIADTSHAAPALPDGSAWTMWQYGWHGRVAGIPGEVDLDVFNGTPQMLASLAGPGDVMVAVAR